MKPNSDFAGGLRLVGKCDTATRLRADARGPIRIRSNRVVGYRPNYEEIL